MAEWQQDAAVTALQQSCVGVMQFSCERVIADRMHF
jgi:hypothetical protein